MNHIVKSYDRDLEEVLGEVTAMGRLVREQLVKAADALEKLNIEVSDEDLLVDEDPADDESETPETDSDNAVDVDGDDQDQN